MNSINMCFESKFWDFHPAKEKDNLINVKENFISFSQKGRKSIDGKGDRVLFFNSLCFEDTYDYQFEFDIEGTATGEITIQIKSGGDTYQNESIILDGTNVHHSFIIRNPNQTSNDGKMLFALGLIQDNKSLIISNIKITKLEKEERKNNVLFIGNSFIFFYAMPLMLENMGEVNGTSLNVEQITYGGYSLLQFTKEEDKLKEVNRKLEKHKWDFVIIQDQSRKPLDNKEEFLLGIERLHDLIKENGAETVLFSTWSYKDNTKRLSSTGLNYKDFYNVLTNGYKEAEQKLNVLRAPIGTVFYNLTINNEDVEPYFNDDYHPSREGSYLIAYLIYTMLFGKKTNDKYIPRAIKKSSVDTIKRYVDQELSEQKK